MAQTKIGEALDLLRKDGWTQIATGKGPNGERCIMSALGTRIAATHGLRTPEFYDALYADRSVIEQVINEQHGPLDGPSLVPSWNDRPATTFADVERVMEKAEAKRLEEI
jgi:hypothetical protein